MGDAGWTPSPASLATFVRTVEGVARELAAEGVVVSGPTYDDWIDVVAALYRAIFTHPYGDRAFAEAPGVPFQRLGFADPDGGRKLYLAFGRDDDALLLHDIAVTPEMRAVLVCHDGAGGIVEVAWVDAVRHVAFRVAEAPTASEAA